MSDGRHDFDFIFGEWVVRNRRLTARFAGSTDWQEFEGRGIAAPILGGIGHTDHISFGPDFGNGYGFTLRLFDLATREWSIYWTDSATGRLFPPMIGRFEHGVGTFVGFEHVGDTTVLCRFTWSDITDTSARWAQSFSNDGGQTWELNWTMDFTRVA
ncbi:MAG: hypothetical protein M3Y37_07770 [Chloroflexota bacterium]|nr:hypothetical protein [Chloroflexota bacterium]